MAYLLKKGNEGSIAKRQERKSKSGRPISTPGNLLTSEEEAPKIKRSKNNVTVNAEIEKLKTLMSTKYAAQCSSHTSQDKLFDSTTALSNKDAKKKETRNNQIDKKFSTNAQDKSYSSSKVIQRAELEVDSAPTVVDGTSNLQKLNTQKETISRKLPEITIPILQEALDHVEGTFINAPKGNVDESYPIIDLVEIANDLKIIKKQNEEIISASTIIIEKLDEMKRSEINGKKTLYDNLKGFPLKTVAEFTQLENDSEESEKIRESLYHHLLTLGGTKLREFLSTSMKQLMTDHLLCEYTWNGEKGMQKFGDTKISNVLFSSAKKCPFFKGPSNVAEYKTEMREVMRISKQRYRNATKDKNQFVADRASYEQLEERIRELESHNLETSENESDQEDGMADDEME
ncbi:uncharacterized protein LOC122507454 isoform X3 [Leptopilina heterotoma]|nr:uncharacterized protein LOC122507454 isoform X3 [Leptopilina heterotoma]